MCSGKDAYYLYSIQCFIILKRVDYLSMNRCTCLIVVQSKLIYSIVYWNLLLFYNVNIDKKKQIYHEMKKKHIRTRL